MRYLFIRIIWKIFTDLYHVWCLVSKFISNFNNKLENLFI